jgi:hypothetical protein
MPFDDWDIAGALEATEGNWDPVEDWERKAQRLRDQHLVDRLACRGFTGPEYATFAAEFAAYGLAVCRAWLTSGIIFSFCARRGRPLGRPPDHWSSDDRHELALETVAVALKEFRERALVRRLWSPDGGASLKTYFIGTCLFVFPNVFRTWQRGEDRWRRIELDESKPNLETATHEDPASIVPLHGAGPRSGQPQADDGADRWDAGVGISFDRWQKVRYLRLRSVAIPQQFLNRSNVVRGPVWDDRRRDLKLVRTS